MTNTNLPRKPTKRLKYDDRKRIEHLCAEGKTIYEISLLTGVHLSTIYRELKRGGDPYRAETAQRSIS